MQLSPWPRLPLLLLALFFILQENRHMANKSCWTAQTSVSLQSSLNSKVTVSLCLVLEKCCLGTPLNDMPPTGSQEDQSRHPP